MLLIAEGITGTDILETYTCADITSVDRLHRYLLVGVHLEQTADTLALAGTWIVDIRTSGYLTGVNTEEHQTAHERISCNLECKSSCRLALERLTVFLFAGVRVSTLDSFCILRRRQESTSIVEQRLHTLVLIRRAEGHRSDLQCAGTLTESSDKLVLRNVLTVEILLHDIVIEVSSSLDHLVVPLLSLVNEVSRNIVHLILSTHCLVVPENSLHLDKVNNTLEVFLCTDRNLYWYWVSAQNILHLLYSLKEVSTRTVHLVNITDTWYIILVGLAPNSLRLRLHTVCSRISSDSTIEDAERTLNLSSEVNVSRGINEVYLIGLAIVCPVTCCSSRCDSDTTLLLLGHPVHCGCSIVYLTNLVSFTCVVQDTLRCGSFTGIDMRHDTDVASQM